MVNRNSYLSLLESVNEAVVGTSKITKTIRAGKPVTSQGTNTAVGGGNASNSGMQWGDPSIGGAMNGAQLAAWLNSQSSGVATNPAKPNKVTRASMASMAEEWDEVDEILAEALEMFGEEDLVTILEYFEETGELPDEFIDLIVSING